MLSFPLEEQTTPYRLHQTSNGRGEPLVVKLAQEEKILERVPHYRGLHLPHYERQEHRSLKDQVIVRSWLRYYATLSRSCQGVFGQILALSIDEIRKVMGELPLLAELLRPDKQVV